MQTENLELSVSMGTADYKPIIAVINQGIDSRLEGFTKSIFTVNGSRLTAAFDPGEVQILMRRLWELAENGDESAYDWEDDILEHHFGYVPLWD